MIPAIEIPITQCTLFPPKIGDAVLDCHLELGKSFLKKFVPDLKSRLEYLLPQECDNFVDRRDDHWLYRYKNKSLFLLIICF